MAAVEEVQFSMKVVLIRGSNKALYVEVGSDFADVLLSFLTLPLGTIVRVLTKHCGNNAGILGSLSSLYRGLEILDSRHFWTEGGKLMLLNPRNSSANECGRLKVQIDDTPPTKYFICPKKKCVSMYYQTRCLCSGSTNKDINMRIPETETQSGDESVFTAQTASFILTDDLQILPSSLASIFQILKLNGIKDTSVLEEKIEVVGLKEIMDLLKASLVSKTPITDTVHPTSFTTAALHERIKFFAPEKYESDALPRARTSQNASSDFKFTVKAFVQESTNRVLLAQTEHDFIDFLFSLLTIPLGRVQFLLGNNTCLGNIYNLYRSVTNSETVKFMKSRNEITRLLEPQIPPHYLSSYQIFSLKQQISPLPLLYDEMKTIDPKGHDSFVKGPTLFIVTDDLVVSAPSSTFIISTLNKMKIHISDIEELELDIGLEEALSILQASLTSAYALTNGLKPFLKRTKAREVMHALSYLDRLCSVDV